MDMLLAKVQLCTLYADSSEVIDTRHKKVHALYAIVS